MRASNSGRPPKNKPVASIPLIAFIDEMHQHFGPMRHYLARQGVKVPLDNYYYVGNNKYGPFASPVHALAAAILATVKS